MSSAPAEAPVAHLLGWDCVEFWVGNARAFAFLSEYEGLGVTPLEAMAAGLPVVANAVGVHAEVVRHSENGFLARTPREWAEAIRLLADNEDLRKRMGTEGRRRLERHYGVAVGAGAWLRLLGRMTRREAA